VDPRSPDFQDALERTLGTSRAEWYGSGTYGLPREELEAMISKAREASERSAEGRDAEPAEDEAPPAVRPGLGPAIDELSTSLEDLQGAVWARTEPG
jgi:hypothetical protein